MVRVLLGDRLGADLLRRASPARLARPAPPLLIVHGESDKIVAVTQSQALHEALLRQDHDTAFVRVGAAGHEDPAFDQDAVPTMVGAWLRARLTHAVQKGKIP